MTHLLAYNIPKDVSCSVKFLHWELLMRVNKQAVHGKRCQLVHRWLQHHYELFDFSTMRHTGIIRAHAPLICFYWSEWNEWHSWVNTFRAGCLSSEVMVSYPTVFPDCLWRPQYEHPEESSGQDKLPVCEEDFYSSNNRDDRRGRVKF